MRIECECGQCTELAATGGRPAHLTPTTNAQFRLLRVLSPVHSLDPNLNLKKIKDGLPYKRPEVLAQWEDALRGAGLPE